MRATSERAGGRLAAGAAAAVIALFGFAPAAAGDGAGHNGPTRKLEAAFSIALTLRVSSKDGCYPSPKRMIPFIRKYGKVEAEIARGTRGARTPDVVHVVRSGTACNGVRLSLRHKNVIYVLDSRRGEVQVLGRKAGRESARANRGPLRGVRVAARTFGLAEPNKRRRFDIRCPGATQPLGGSMLGSGIAPDGEGVYPHSFERLGTQRGWHVSGWLRDPTAPRRAKGTTTIQVVCGLGLAPTSAPHRTTFVRPGETKTVIARCPRGQYLFSGGFQRTDFLMEGGDYITESRAAGPQAWQVSAAAFGGYGGELTAIAYCVKSPGPLMSEVSASGPVPGGGTSDVKSPQCPAGQLVTNGGFSFSGSDAAFFAGGTFNPDNTWTARAYGYKGPAELTAYAYCLTPGT